QRAINRYDNKCLDVSGSGTGDGTNIQTWGCNGTGAQTVNPVSGGGGGGSGIASVLSEAQFNSFFPQRNGIYTYQNLVNAANQVGFAMEADMTIRKRHVAAILASMAHEADYLRATREYSSCSSYPYSCPYGWYFGRGAIQLSWASN